MLVWGMGYAWRSLSFKRAPRFSPLFLCGCLCVCMAATLWAVKSQDKITKDLAVLAAGTGLYGTAAHSVNDREKSLSNTIAVFEKSPLVGYSLGGVATAIAVEHGTLVAGNSDAKHNEGGSVIVEVLAASGIIGVIPFLLYFGVLIGKPLSVSRRVGTQAGTVLAALTWAFLMELLILQFNQNILRAYLWFHVGVLSAAYTAVLAGAWRAPGIAVESPEPTRPPRIPMTGVLR
jgi:O-antigen ligase